MAWCILISKRKQIQIRSKFNYMMQHIHTNQKDDVTNLKSIWNDDINDDIDDMHPLISIKNTWKVEKHDLKNDFIVQSCNTLNQKLQKFENDGFITSSNSMIIYEYGCWIFLRQLNENKNANWTPFVLQLKDFYHSHVIIQAFNTNSCDNIIKIQIVITTYKYHTFYIFWKQK
jgi:hypothetical protein